MRVVDGDTVILKLTKVFEMEVDFGFYIKEKVTSVKSTVMSFRLLGIDTPEVVGAEKAAGLLAKAELERLFGLGKITATTHKPDKYGRWLVTLAVTREDGTVLNVNDELVAGGFAVPYMV